MKILLINPTSYRAIKLKKSFSQPAMPSVGIGMLTAILKPLGKLTLCDVPVQPPTIIKKILSSNYDFILISVASFNYFDACEIVDDYSLDKNSTLILGGPHVSIEKQGVFDSGKWDYAVMGEGENIITDIITSSSKQDIPGLLIRGEQKFIPANRINNLDKLPYADFSLYNMDNYSNIPILTSRGCPFVCSFCAINSIWGRIWFNRNISSVIKEMVKLKEVYGNKLFHINDDNFTLDPNRVEMFCKELKKYGNFRWVAQGVRADKVSRKLLKQMRNAGCERISIGVESADEDTLAAIGKSESIRQIQKSIWMARDAGIDVLSMFVLGTCSESRESVEKSFEFVKKNRLYPVDFYQLIPYPTTKEWECVQKEGTLLVKDYRDFDHYSEDPVFETKKFTKEDRIEYYQKSKLLCKNMERAWYLKKHFRSLNPFILFRRPLKDIIREIVFWLALPLKLFNK